MLNKSMNLAHCEKSSSLIKSLKILNKISYLSESVLPRRYKQLNEILYDPSMPEQIKILFATKQLKLIILAQKHLNKLSTITTCNTPNNNVRTNKNITTFNTNKATTSITSFLQLLPMGAAA
jgi:hypothetical protein